MQHYFKKSIFFLPGIFLLVQSFWFNTQCLENENLSPSASVLRGVNHVTQQISNLVCKELQSISKDIETIECKEKTIINKLDKCCSTLNSKLDILLEGFTISAACDVNLVSSRIDSCCNQLLSSIDNTIDNVDDCCSDIATLIQSSFSTVNDNVDECCGFLSATNAQIAASITTISSKVETLSEDVVNCCSTLSSKLDILAQGITVNAVCNIETISSRIDSCCNLLNSQIDSVSNNVTITAVCDVSTISSTIDQCCTALNNSVNIVSLDTTSCCFTVNSKIDTFITQSQLCAAIPVSGETTLTAAGTYCLAQDITSASAQTVLIASNNIVLDLNAHNISNTATNGAGIRLTGSSTGVIIKNGSLTKLGNTGTGNGIDFIASTHDIIIDRVTIREWNLGISGLQLESVVINDCVLQNQASHAINIDTQSINIQIIRCNINNNAGDGIRIGGSSRIKVEDCSINENNNGVNITAGSVVIPPFANVSSIIHVNNCTCNLNNVNAVLVDQNSSCVEITACSASHSTLVLSSDGFNVASGTNILVKDCFACGLNRGFVANGTATNIINNVAKDNSAGFAFTGGTGVASNNTADNGATGFNLLAGAYQFYSNKACGNTLNYTTNILSAPVTSPANARGVDNIDCSNNTPNQVSITQSKLDVCCNQLNSKIDVVSSSITTLITCDTSTVVSRIDQCCTDLNSAIDTLSLCNATPITSTTSITSAGHYCLANNISAAGPIITIASDSVWLDLNGHTLTSLGAQAILINTTTTHTDINIYNGFITGSGDGIATPLSGSRQNNVQIKNISITNMTGIGINLSTIDNLVIDDCALDANFSNIVISVSDNIQILNSVARKSGNSGFGATLLTCENVYIQSSLFDNNGLDGLRAQNIQSLLIQDSLFTNNNTAGLLDIAGMSLNNCSSAQIINSHFDINDTGASSSQHNGVVLINSNFNITFEQCSFNRNTNNGALIQSTSVSSCIKFVQCQANANLGVGFHVLNNVNDVLFDSCFACNNATIGFNVATNGVSFPSNICFIKSTAKNNNSVGFMLSAGTGLLKENQALGNGVGSSNGCGFDDLMFASGNYSYVANIAKRNGNTPAAATDSNYCVASSPSTLIGNGPGIAPYRQVTLGLPPRSYWDNVTLN